MITSKKAKIFLLVIFIIGILITFNYAAIVSDDDGSAFVTKEEFESLKDTFNGQLKNYNDSLTGKIDGAIASYLAGINKNKQEKLEICHTRIGYPMTLRMLGPYNGDDVKNIKTLNKPTNLWTDGYDIFFYGSRNHIHIFAKNNVVKTPNNVIKNFYNGSISGGKFYISEVYSNFNIKAYMNTSVHQFGQNNGPVAYESFGMNIFFDENSYQASGQTQYNSWDRRNYIYETNARKFTFPRDTFPYVVDMWMNYRGGGVLTVNSSSLTSTAGIDKKWNVITCGTSMSGWREPTQRHSSWTQISSYNAGKINEIFCGSLSSSSNYDMLVPVLYSGKIKLTNINEAKTALSTSNTSGDNKRYECHTYYGYGGSRDQANCYIEYVVDPGLVIDPETNLTTPDTDWNNASLIKGERCYYKETWPHSKTSEDMKLTAGIPLCEIPTAESTLTISFTPSWDSTNTQKRYFMLSKEPIDETTDRPDISPHSAKYLNIIKDNVESKYVELINDTSNKFIVKDLNKGDKIYYKVVWDTTDTTDLNNYKNTTIIDEPYCVVTYE